MTEQSGVNMFGVAVVGASGIGYVGGWVGGSYGKELDVTSTSWTERQTDRHGLMEIVCVIGILQMARQR